jgi:Mg-chelatase subunit ChlD
MNGGSGFTLTISQNKFLARGAREVNAIVTIESNGLGGAWAEPDTGMAEVIILDTSASMEWPITKIMAARQAAMKAVDNLRDGVSFAVIAGNHVATMVYPREEQTVKADRRTKIEAKAAIGGLAPSGGTAMGSWLQLAAHLFAPHREDLRHAILLTDGKNEHEAPEQFGATLSAVARCRGDAGDHRRRVRPAGPRAAARRAHTRGGGEGDLGERSRSASEGLDEAGTPVRDHG